MIEFRIWIDIAKGIGIILVVIGHTIGSQRVNDIIYTFHMPLFFILSGYLLKDIYSIQDFKRNLINKSKRLLIPLLCYMLLIVLPMEINWLREGETTLLNIIWRFFNVYTFAKDNAFWFPYSLFLGIIIYNTIQYNTIQYNLIQYNPR